MHFLNYTPQRERFIQLLWGLLFTKCFIAEHYVQAHAVPIASWLYVWGLSLSMATVATIVFWRLRTTEHVPSQGPRALVVGWVLGLGAGIMCVLLAWLTPWLSTGGLMVAFSAILAGGYGWQAWHSRARLDWLPAVGWCLMAGLQLTIPADVALLVFGLSLLAWVVLPLACKLILDWYQGKAAVRALYIANDI